MWKKKIFLRHYLKFYQLSLSQTAACLIAAKTLTWQVLLLMFLQCSCADIDYYFVDVTMLHYFYPYFLCFQRIFLLPLLWYCVAWFYFLSSAGYQYSSTAICSNSVIYCTAQSTPTTYQCMSDVEYSRSSPQYSEQSAELIWSTALNYWALIEGAARVRRDTGKDC